MSDLDLDKHPANTTEVTDGVRGALSSAELSRRSVLRGFGTVTLGVAAVGTFAACGGAGSTTPPAGAGTAAGSAGLAKVADIPVGGAIAAVGTDGKPIILSQPTAGKVVGMSAICTHMGCTVAPDGANLVCPCHGSVYKSSDGSNVSGPAPSPLPAVAVKVVNGEVVAG